MKNYLPVLLLLMLIISCKKNKDIPYPLAPVLTITSIDPTTGSYNAILTINGSNFSPVPSENIVTIGGEQAKVESSTSTTITVLVPKLKEGNLPVVVTSNYGKAGGFSFTYTYNVYVAGYEIQKGTFLQIAKYWVNGKETLLSNVPGNLNNSKAYSIFVSGNDVYVAGTNFNAVYWKNDTLVTLDNAYSSAYSIYVQGKDVYAAGEELISTGFIAKYWKNGVATNLTGKYENAIAKSIYVTDNGDVYIAGQEVYGNPAAVYWKNGVIANLTDGSIPATANAIYVNGNGAYVVGNISTQAVYWKNNVPVYVTDGTWSATINALCIVGNKLYLAGYQRSNSGYDVARYWVYDCTTNTRDMVSDYSDATSSAALNGIAFEGNSVYFAGFQDTQARYAVSMWWTSGATTSLSNGVQAEYATSIYIK